MKLLMVKWLLINLKTETKLENKIKYLLFLWIVICQLWMDLLQLKKLKN